MQEETEIWKPIKGYEDTHDVSNLGRVRRSLTAPIRGSTKRGRILKGDAATGYIRVTLRSDAKSDRKLLHRLVANAFLDGMPRQHVNHKDGNKLNNRLDNLEYVTDQENVRHAWRMGLCKAHKGSDHGGAKLTDADVNRIRRAAALGIPHASLATVFEVTETSVSYIVLGKTWRHLIATKESVA